jgi:hypothetical protein
MSAMWFPTGLGHSKDCPNRPGGLGRRPYARVQEVLP